MKGLFKFTKREMLDCHVFPVCAIDSTKLKINPSNLLFISIEKLTVNFIDRGKRSKEIFTMTKKEKLR